jgi:hypothetical protein
MKFSLEIALLLTQLIAVPIAVAVFIWDRRAAQQARDEACYKEVSDLFDNFVRLGIENPGLGLFGYDCFMPAPTTEEERIQKEHVIELVLSMLERIHFLYNREGISSRFRRRQWGAWDAYMRDWAKNEFFRSYWKAAWDGGRMDTEFASYMNSAINEAGGENSAPQPKS